MATSHMVPIASRFLKATSLLLAAVMVLATSGCVHRRSSMRPVFVDSGVPVNAPSSVVADDAIDASPSVPLGDLDADPRLAPAKPNRDSSVRPSRVAPGAAPLNEPDFTLPKTERTPKANIKGPDLEGPSARREGPGTRRTSGSRTRKTSLAENVRPFVNDPDELFQPTKADRPWKYVVVHHSANASGSYDQIDREHRKIQGWDGCGYHFVIGNGTGSPDGTIEVARRWSNQKHGLHCRNGKNPDVNEYGVGICLIGDLDGSPPTPKQVAAARALVAYLANRYEIPSEAVGTHAELADGPTACPGKHFPAEQIFGAKHLASN